MRTRWAWVLLAGLAALVAVAVVLVLSLSSIPFPPNADGLFVLAGVPWAVVGAVLVARRTENVVGKLLVVLGSIWLLGEASKMYLWMSLHTSLPGTDLAAWFTSWMGAPAWMLIPLLLAIFPSGRVASPWLRWPVRVYIALLVVVTLGGAVSPTSPEESADYLAHFVNPLGIEALTTIESGPLGTVIDVSSIWAVMTLALLSIVDLVRRWRTSRGVERLQVRTFALGALSMVLLFLVGAAMAALNLPKPVESLTTTLGLSAPPIAVGVAILRYRLYEIDRMISRTVTYALVVGLLAALFAVVAIGLPRLLQIPEENTLVVAGATLAVAALFNPLRRRVQVWVDRRFNRARYDAQQEVDHFSERLRSELEVDDIADEMLGLATKTMQPTGASVWIKEESP